MPVSRRNVLGLKKDDYVTWKEILLEVMPNFMDREKTRPEADILSLEPS